MLDKIRESVGLMDANAAYSGVMRELRKRIAGKAETLELLFIGLIADGHVLLEGAPGLAKTTMTKSLAEAINADFKRIQGTPDLEPKDILGYTYIDESKEVKFSKGPVFTNILLIDELNRTQPKTMSALLESLEERQVTAGGETMALPRPFTAFATQNPLKIEGTEPLPKVLADRFLMKIDVDYPSPEEEQQMLRLKESNTYSGINRVLSTDDILAMQREAAGVSLPDDVAAYITRVVAATRTEMHVVMGASPRADIAFMQCAKAKALIEGRKEVSREDIKFLARPVLSHRITVRSTGGIGVKGVIDGIIASVK